MAFAYGLITAGIGFLLGFGSATYFAMRLAEIAAVNDHIDDIKQIENLAVSYWLGEAVDLKARRCLENRIRGKLHASAIFRAKFSGMLGGRLKEYVALEAELFDMATGGDFEARDFRPDPVVAVSIMTTCNELRALLRIARRQLYWAH